MINKTVVTSYRSQAYLIHDIDFKKNPRSEYQRGSNIKPISYVEHFQKVLKVQLESNQNQD